MLCPARAAGKPIICDVELLARAQPEARFVAITGTNGKSTTTALIAHILRASGRDTQLGGNIGTAVLTLDPPKAGRFYVVECSSYQIDLAPTLNPSAGILINLTPDHLDRHGSMERYLECKANLFANQRSGDVAVLNLCDRAVAGLGTELARRSGGPRVDFFSTAGPGAGPVHPVSWVDNGWMYLQNERVLPLSDRGVVVIAKDCKLP